LRLAPWSDGNDLTGGFHADVGNQQLLFQLFKQIIVDLLAAEQTDKSGTEVLFGFQQAAFQAGEETFFGRFFLLLTASRRFRPAPLQRRFLPHRRRQRLRFQLFIGYRLSLFYRFVWFRLVNGGFFNNCRFRFGNDLFRRLFSDGFSHYRLGDDLFHQRLSDRLFNRGLLRYLLNRRGFDNRLRLFALHNLLGHLNHLGGKGFGILFLCRSGVDRFRRNRRRFAFLSRFFNLLLGFYFLFCFGFLRLFFLSKAQPGKEATFFVFAICDYTPRCLFMAQLRQIAEAEK
jgi:hypothetical protein